MARKTVWKALFIAFRTVVNISLVELDITDGQGYSGSPLLNKKGEVIGIVRCWRDPPVDDGAFH